MFRPGRHLLFLLGLELLAGLGLSASPARAEPWLSTRYAQNCAGCHAPGRKNLKAADRRCTLSCQGCHVNPNGGGLRSGYGKWNEDRWLRSFRSSVLAHEKSTAPTDKQYYGRSGSREKEKDKSDKEKGDKADEDDKKKKPKADARRKRRVPKAGYPLIESEEEYPPEQAYLRDGREFEIVDDEEFMAQIPQDDPLRTLEDQKTDAGADIRWQWAQYKRDSEKSTLR